MSAASLSEAGFENLSIKDLASFPITKLQGQHNYPKWERDFKVVAQFLNMWGFINNKEMAVNKPDVEDFFAETEKKSKRTPRFNTLPKLMNTEMSSQMHMET
jgi:hypothetical protein